jgi:hypothetical protein
MLPTLPPLAARESPPAPPPKQASGVRSMNFERELSGWFEVLVPTQRTGAVAASSRPPRGRIPFLIF